MGDPHRVLGLSENAPRLSDERPPGFGKLNPALTPVKQLDSQLLLEPCDLLAERWLRHLQAASSPPEMELIGQGDNVAKLSSLISSRY